MVLHTLDHSQVCDGKIMENKLSGVSGECLSFVVVEDQVQDGYNELWISMRSADRDVPETIMSLWLMNRTQHVFKVEKVFFFY